MSGKTFTNDVSGDFEVHVTVHSGYAGELAGFAEEHGLKYTHVVLDRGQTSSQPMLTLTGSGSLDQQRGAAERWAQKLRAAGIPVARVKIEAAPWCDGVPVTDLDAARQPSDRYFEHHVKLLLPAGVSTLVAVTEVAERHEARLSRNARRVRDDGRRERFVTQRCHRVGRTTARARLDELVAALRDAGQEIVAVEQEYVVSDDRIELDEGWLTQPEDKPDSWTLKRESQARKAPAGKPGYPATYKPLPGRPGVRQRAAFDPAVKQYDNAYRAGEPVFSDADTGQRWRAARRAAMRHLIKVVADTRWAEHLVLRGSVTMAAWLGAAAREPGDVDFVVLPFSMYIHSDEARAMLAGVLQALRDRPGAGLAPDLVQTTDIWTYERADGRRLVIPFGTDDGLTGSVQADFVFNEHLPLEPVTVELDGVEVKAASPALSLAWKLMWLATDIYPQGKDLYDAVLLAEHTTVDLELVRELLRPELGAEADDFTAASALDWRIDWRNFADEYPGVLGDAKTWQRRLARVLDRGFTTT
ncbi:hypothetical protein C1I95_22130 [Micromonospora craterilacus]|uniref:Nucleotidyl transferase AbiEii/AbiGii toxin family protein n=1 Tax=Micromonospora craterilacus TaxID=1655439 RepID=A0A2W2EPC5_9ACTN|nr:nucleotidyl transferase AbiEii/AbiGii toxin family protein [Micromonospora craterilacus]PZG14268.1 hypothetical protein C1I95_22130 [Micromonospora craterilacus]